MELFNLCIPLVVLGLLFASIQRGWSTGVLLVVTLWLTGMVLFGIILETMK